MDDLLAVVDLAAKRPHRRVGLLQREHVRAQGLELAAPPFEMSSDPLDRSTPADSTRQGSPLMPICLDQPSPTGLKL